MNTVESRGYQARLWILAAVVVAWRIAAYLVADEGPDGWLRLGLAGLGLLFVVCGLVAYNRWPGRASLLFALYALCTGLHWGGPIGSSNLSENPVWLSVYLVVSSILGGTLFLHFAIEFPPAWRSGVRDRITRLIYLPTVIATLLLPFVVVASPEQSLGATARTGFLAAYTIGVVFPYLAAAVFALRIFKSKPRAPAAIVLVGTVLGALPGLLHSSLGLPGPYDAYNLFIAIEPIAILAALSLSQPVRSS